ncbi:FkbM family methyltransferase [Microcoleus anatoxicus]|uniref:FkbM family methyltransferase n=1 Tax=Microcoleus anatoxicus PTRS2 TaxID=2705321 RepID=A0ABU8YL23_9CYAN
MNPEAAKRLEAAIQKTLSTHAKNDKSYLWMAYQVIFEREADAEGLKAWLDQINNGVSRSTVIERMMQSIEFQQRHPSSTKFLPSTSGRILVELPEFKIYAMTNDSAVGQTIISTQNYEPHVTNAILKHLKGGDVFLDIGANIGYFTLLAASIVKDFGQVISFEPNPQNLQLIYSSIVENQFDNITIYPFAASNFRQILTLATGGSNGTVFDASLFQAENCYFVPSMVVDELLQHEQQINVIKMDIEGHEPSAIRGMDLLIRKHKPIIFTEFHPWCIRFYNKTEPQEYLEQLTQYGYRLFIIERVEEGGKITEAPDTKFVINFWEEFAEKVNFDRIHLDLMALPL